MRDMLRPGIEHELRYRVPESKVVAELYPEAAAFQAMPRVFATGFFVGLMEWACIEAINPHLDWPREQTVGTRVDVTHEAATPPGLEVVVRVNLMEVDGRRLVFAVEASDGAGTIGRGRHERTVIDYGRFTAKAQRKHQTYAGVPERSAGAEANSRDLRHRVEILAVDIFGTTVDWWTGVSAQAAAIAAELDVELDAGALADAWRERYLPAMARVRTGERPWAYLDTLHRESLDELLEDLGVADVFDESARHRLVTSWHQLPAWGDVAEGLRRLRTRYTVVALSNGGFALLTRLLKHNRLHFDAVLSAENARTYKPDPAVYRAAADLLDVSPERMLMVAAHAWDTEGARDAGLRTAFVTRPAEKGPHGTADRPEQTASDVVAADFIDLANTLGC